MTPEQFSSELERFRSELQGILSRFTQSSDRLSIRQSDDPIYRQRVRELRDFLNDHLGANSYSAEIREHYSAGLNNYFESPSYKSVENIIGVIGAVLTRVSRNPDLLNRGDHTQRPSTLAPPDSVTLSWLYQHVPAKLWASAAGILATAFLAGVSISQVPFVRRLLDPYFGLTRSETTRGEGIAQVLDRRTKELIAGHNARVAELQKAIAAEEHSYGVSPGYGHREAVQRLREDLKAEYQRYEVELSELRKLAEQAR